MFREPWRQPRRSLGVASTVWRWSSVAVPALVVGYLLGLLTNTITLRSTGRRTLASACPTLQPARLFVTPEQLEWSFLRYFQTAQMEKYELYRPLVDYRSSFLAWPILISPPEHFVPSLEEHLEELHRLTMGRVDTSVVTDRARTAYLRFMAQYITAKAFRMPELSFPSTVRDPLAGGIHLDHHPEETEWSFVGDSRAEYKRLAVIGALLKDAFENNVQGDYVEAGVGRGGAAMFARAVMRVYGQGQRMVYLCDSFQRGRGNSTAPRREAYVGVPAHSVAARFRQAGLLDEHVVFADGSLHETIRPLSEQLGFLALIRVDRAMYPATAEVLFYLYDKLSIGGYVMIENWSESKEACVEFFTAHTLRPKIVTIDDQAVYWQKTEHIVDWKYMHSTFRTTEERHVSEYSEGGGFGV